MKGRTVLIPKTEDEQFDPSKFRPITCLHTCCPDRSDSAGQPQDAAAAQPLSP